MYNIVDMRLYYYLFRDSNLQAHTPKHSSYTSLSPSISRCVSVFVCMRAVFYRAPFKSTMLFHSHLPFIIFRALYRYKPALHTINNGYANPFRVVYACIHGTLAWLLCHRIFTFFHSFLFYPSLYAQLASVCVGVCAPFSIH